MVDEPSHGGERLLEVSHVAHRLSVGPDYVWRLIRDGKLKAIRLGTRYRIKPAELEAWIERQGTSDDGPAGDCTKLRAVAPLKDAS
jgi:excisionase family DNA binding protein